MFCCHSLNLSFNRICSFFTPLIEMGIRPITTCGKHYHRHFLCLFRLRRGGLKRPHTPLASPKANPFEVPVTRRTRGAFGLSCRLVVVPLAFSVGASHTDGVSVEHRHRSPTVKARSASIAGLLREECIHLIFSFLNAWGWGRAPPRFACQSCKSFCSISQKISSPIRALSSSWRTRSSTQNLGFSDARVS